jgi:PAS domain S-box-containing protein
LERPRATRLTALDAPASEGDAEALFRSTLDALSAHIAVLDRTGTIVAVNEAWRSFARSMGLADRRHGVGMNYLAVCERGARTSDDAARTAAALRHIIGGSKAEFRMEYPCESPDGLRWFQLRVTRPEAKGVSRIVVAHEDITVVKRAQDALARLSSRLIHVQDEERRAIARELHDTTAQNLLAITLNASRLRKPVSSAGQPARRILAETMSLAEQCLREVRTLSYLLHPPLLDDIGLASALRWFAKGFSERSGIHIDVRGIEDQASALPRDVATTLFRVAQEALSNVHRHSGSRWARIALRRAGQAICLDVIDRGRGLPKEIESRADVETVGVGISGMRVRLEQLGGRLEMRSSSAGTRVTATVPIPWSSATTVSPASAPDPGASLPLAKD